jgi:PIN domain nuclease of toxin-antitoxin system
MKTVVLDTSVLIAYLHKEKGSDEAIRYLYDAVISTVIYSEFLYVMMDKGFSRDDLERVIDSFGIEIIAFDEEQAVIAAELRNQTKDKGLSLGDRACLALAIVKKIPVVTADKIWSKLKVGVDVKLIR